MSPNGWFLAHILQGGGGLGHLCASPGRFGKITRNAATLSRERGNSQSRSWRSHHKQVLEQVTLSRFSLCGPIDFPPYRQQHFIRGSCALPGAMAIDVSVGGTVGRPGLDGNAQRYVHR